jgi:hypothetical protein
VRRLHYAMVADGLVWLSAVLWLVISNAIAREFRPVGMIADFLDKLPSAVGTPIFILLWLVFLLGWVVPLSLGARPLFKRRPNSQDIEKR